MNTLNIFVCENFSPEFESTAADEGFEDVVITTFPCMCENKNRIAQTKMLFQENEARGVDGLLLCSRSCDAIRLIPDTSLFEIKSTDYCFNHLTNEGIINYIIQKGGYIVGSGWLKQWRRHIEDAGFNRDTAQLFYHEFCRELVYFDSGIVKEADIYLRELSEYLDLPYVVVPLALEGIQLLLRSAVYEWRLQKSNTTHSKSISEIQAQCAEYAAILDLIGKISSYKSRRETIEKIKEIFMAVLGAQQFKYWNNEYEKDGIPADIQELIADDEKSFVFMKEKNRFFIKIEQKSKVYGVIDVSDFLFPQYLEKYLNFALEITKVTGLVMTNVEQYEKLTKSENELRYFSFHDSLTGLYNRTYLNEILMNNKNTCNLAVFMFDIDKLKYVNDNYGHLEGDKLICSTAEVLKKCFRETDTAARIGGDEFVAILPECDIGMAEIFKDRICDAIAANNKKETAPHLQLSVSIGFAVSEGADETLEKLIIKADELMYVDKIGKRR